MYNLLRRCETHKITLWNMYQNLDILWLMRDSSTKFVAISFLSISLISRVVIVLAVESWSKHFMLGFTLLWSFPRNVFQFSVFFSFLKMYYNDYKKLGWTYFSFTRNNHNLHRISIDTTTTDGSYCNMCSMEAGRGRNLVCYNRGTP